MKELLIARHAKSSWDNPLINDFDRPLNDRGKKDGPIMVERVKRHGFMPDHIFCSPAKRTRKTLKFFTESLRINKNDVEYPAEMYLASAGTLMELLYSTPENSKSVMLVGHNPGLTDLINLLTVIKLDNLPTAGICCIRFELNDWNDLVPKSGDVLYLEYPRLYYV